MQPVIIALNRVPSLLSFVAWELTIAMLKHTDADTIIWWELIATMCSATTSPRELIQPLLHNLAAPSTSDDAESWVKIRCARV